MTAITEQVYQTIKTQGLHPTPAHQRQIAELTGMTQDTIEYERTKDTTKGR